MPDNVIKLRQSIIGQSGLSFGSLQTKYIVANWHEINNNVKSTNPYTGKGNWRIRQD